MGIEIRTNARLMAGFIPHRLVINDKPELSDFPLNILFGNFITINGVDMSATALYKPDVESYREGEGGRSLDYRNIYNQDNLVTITRQEEKWTGTKVINEKVTLIAEGRMWQQFFTQLTIVGLSNGEKCRYQSLPLKESNQN